MTLHKVSVTYKAPPGDNKVVEMFGHTFFDGKSEEIEVDDDSLARLQGNRHFECGKATEVKKDEPRKMSDAERKAADAKALAEENQKRAAQGQPPVDEEDDQPRSKSDIPPPKPDPHAPQGGSSEASKHKT